MSPITDALLIGSAAASIHGILPAWRDGAVGDIDFVCTMDAAARIMALFGDDVICHAPDRAFRIGRDGARHVDLDLRGHLLPLTTAWSDEMLACVNGHWIMARVARPELVAALRIASIDVVPAAADKARRDAEWYRSVVTVPSALMDIASQFRKPSFAA